MTTQAPHPIRLEHVIFTRSIVVAVPGHIKNPQLLANAPVTTINVAKVEGEPKSYEASMQLVINPQADKADPYHIEMECHAKLIVDDTLSDEDAYRGVFITAHTVLYGAIREAVAWITTRQPYGGLMLGLSVLNPTPKKNAVQ